MENIGLERGKEKQICRDSVSKREGCRRKEEGEGMERSKGEREREGDVDTIFVGLLCSRYSKESTNSLQIYS